MTPMSAAAGVSGCRAASVVVGAAILLVGVVGCGLADPRQTSSEPVASPAWVPQHGSSASPDAESVRPDELVAGPIAKHLTMGQAHQIDLSGRPALPDGFDVGGVGPSGELLVTTWQETGTNARTDVALLNASSVGRLTAAGFQPVAESIKDPFGVTGNYDQITSVSATSDWLVWVETPSTDLDYQEWIIRAAGPGGQVREIARSTTLPAGQRFPDCLGGTRPVIAGDWVYWATAVPVSEQPSGWRIDIQRAKLSVASAVETVARDAAMPKASGGHTVAYFQRTSDGNYQLVVSQADGPSRILATTRGVAGYYPTALVASDQTVAWTMSRPAAGVETPQGYLFVVDVRTGAMDSIQLDSEGGEGGSLALTSRGLVWGSGSGRGDAGEYLYDVATGGIVRFATSEGASTVFAHPDTASIVWATPGAARPVYLAGSLR